MPGLDVLRLKVEDLKSGLSKFAAMFTRSYGLRIVFQGSDAKTNGKTIVVPEVSLLIRSGMTSSEIKEAEDYLVNIRAHVYHESLHVIETDFPFLTSYKPALRGPRKHLVNALEDARIETKGGALYPGAREVLEFSNRWLVGELFNVWQKERPDEVTQILKGALILLLFENEYVKLPAWSLLSAEAQKMISRIKPKLLKAKYASTTKEVVEIAESIWKEIKRERKKEEDDKRRSDGGAAADAAGRKRKRGDRQRGSGRAGDDSLAGEEGSAEEHDEGGSGGAGGGSSAADDGGDERAGDGVAADHDRGKRRRKRRKKRSDERTEEEEASPEADEGGDDRGEGGRSGGSGEGGSQGDEDEDEADEEAEGGTGAGEGDEEEGFEAEEAGEVGKAVRAEEGDSGQLIVAGSVGASLDASTREALIQLRAKKMVVDALASGAAGEYRVYTTVNDTIGMPKLSELVEQRCKADAKTRDDAVRGVCGPLSRGLSNLLRARTHSFYVRGLEDGELDPDGLHVLAAAKNGDRRVRLQSRNVFRQKIEAPALDTVVELSVDNSGSMRGLKAQLAGITALAFGDALEAGRVPFGVSTWTTADMGTSAKVAASVPVAERPLYARFGGLKIYDLKRHDEPWQAVRWRMGLITGDQANYDGESVLFAAKRLAVRREKRKVMIVICDGLPSGDYGEDRVMQETFLHRVVKHVRSIGIKLIGIGIYAPEVSKFYAPDFVNVTDIQELPTTVLQRLQTILLPGVNA